MSVRYWMLVLLAWFGLSFSQNASAATYRCSSATGQVYFSDRPCGGTSDAATGGTKLGGAGPVEQGDPRARAYSYTPTIPKPPEHAKYLVGPCAEMEEAIRPAPVRGIQGQTLRSLYEDYRTKCDYQVREAQERVNADKREQDRMRTEQRQMAAAQQAEGQRLDHQCANMRAVIADKRASLSTLNDRQRELLQNMQDNYNRTCLNRR
jgi:hypothetical protein